MQQVSPLQATNDVQLKKSLYSLEPLLLQDFSKLI